PRTTEIRGRAVCPLLERLSKAGRVGKTDAFGDLVYPHMGILKKLGRKRSTHPVDDGLIGQTLLSQSPVEGAQGEAELGGNAGGGGKSVWAVKTCGAYPSNQLGFAGTLGQDHIANLLADFRRDRVGVRAGHIEDFGVEVPFHAVSIEVNRAVEH